LEQLEQRYVLEVPVTTPVWTADPATCVPAYSGRGQPPRRPTRESVRPAAAVAEALPAGAWRAMRVREGAVGPLVFEFAAVRVWAMRHQRPGPPIWLLIRRSLEERPEVKYYVSNAGADTAPEALALVACSRFRVEEFFEDCKGYLGMARYETRSWAGWHHHMRLVGLAHLFVTLTRLRLKKRSRR
jgi:SRSO17 transposase